MSRTNVRIVFLAALLAQGVSEASAKQLPPSHESLRPFPSENLSKSKLSSLGLGSLALPNQPSEVEVTEFRPISILEIEKLIKTNNYSLKASAMQVAQAKSKLLASISSWYPSLDLSSNGLPQYLSADHHSNSKYSTTPDLTSSQWKRDFSAKIKWNLIDPARVPQIALARANYERARDSYLIQLRDLVLEGTIQYFQLQRADEGVQISENSVKSSATSLKDAEVRFNAGIASKFEVLQAETQLLRDKSILSRSILEQKNARSHLASIVNLPQNVAPITESPLKVFGEWEPTLQESLIGAYTYREELDRLILDVSINNSKANEALAATQPVISIFNTLSTYRTDGQVNVVAPVEPKDYSWNTTNTVGITATWKLFDGGNARAMYRYNKEKAKESEYAFIAERNRIRKDVEDSFFNLSSATQNIETTSMEVMAQREALRLARLRVDAGISTQREVINNQRDLTQAELNHADAIANYNKSLLQLRRRTGLDKINLCGSIDLLLDKMTPTSQPSDLPNTQAPPNSVCFVSRNDDQA